MDIDKRDIETLLALRDGLEKPNDVVESSRIHNPSQAIQGTLADFLTRRLDRVEEDAAFIDLIRAAIRTRLPEADMNQLIQLLHELSMDNNRSFEGVANLFKNENSGRTVLDTVRSSDTESTAAQLYASTDNKEILQAVNYLGAVMAKLTNNQSSPGDAELVN